MIRGLAQRTPFYYGWVVAGAVLMTMTISGAVAAPMFSVFIPRWTEEFGWSRTAISGAFSFGTVAAALAGPLVGRALDRYGGRLVMGGGGLLMAASVAGLGFVGSLVGLYAALVAGRTALMSIQNLGGHTVIANWFVRRRAFATAVAVNGSRLGLGLWPLLGAALIAVMGWREALWMVGGLMALLSLFPLVAIVSRQPEDVGLHPDGRPPLSMQEDHPRQARTEREWRPREAIRTQAFWLLLFAHMGAMVAGGGYGLHRIPLFLDRGLAEGLVGPVLMFHAVGMLVGGFVAAWFMGRTSYRIVIAGCMAGASGAMAAAGFIPAGCADGRVHVRGIDGFRRRFRDVARRLCRIFRTRLAWNDTRYRAPCGGGVERGRAGVRGIRVRNVRDVHDGPPYLQRRAGSGGGQCTAGAPPRSPLRKQSLERDDVRQGYRNPVSVSGTLLTLIPVR